MSQPTTEQNQALINSKAFQVGTLLTDGNGDTQVTESLLFSDTNSQLAVNENLFWDDTNERLGVGISTGALGKVHIDQSSDTGAIPVLHLDQADISEEFIEMAGSPNGNIMTQSIVADASATTFTAGGWLRINIVSDNSALMSSGAYYVAFGGLT